MPTVSRSAVDERAKCDAPAAEFVAFARGLVTARSERRLRALAERPVAELFARRLVQEALSGAAHAVICITLIGRLGKDPGWARKLQQENVAGRLPAVDALPPRDLEPVGRGLLVVSRRLALSWIADAYLHVKVKTAAASAVEKLLLESAVNTRALAGALEDALGAMRSRGEPISDPIVRRTVAVVEKHARRFVSRNHRAEESVLLQLAKNVSPADAARLLSALLLGLLRGETADASRTEAELRAQSALKAGQSVATTAIAEAAWSDADEALGRALQDMDLLVRSFDRLESLAKGELADPARRARNASNLVLQWVQQAARYRRVAVLNKPGDRVPFDPAVHELDGEAGIGELIRIVKPAVVRGSEPQQVVLLRAVAELD